MRKKAAERECLVRKPKLVLNWVNVRRLLVLNNFVHISTLSKKEVPFLLTAVIQKKALK